MKKLRKMKNQKGFTLVEVIVVLVILAIMAAILIPSLVGYIDKAKQNSIRTQTQAVVQASQTLVSEAYANGVTLDNISFVATTDTETKYSGTGADKKAAISFTQIAALSEQEVTDGTLIDGPEIETTDAGTKGQIKTLTYTDGSNTCVYDKDQPEKYKIS